MRRRVYLGATVATVAVVGCSLGSLDGYDSGTTGKAGTGGHPAGSSGSPASSTQTSTSVASGGGSLASSSTGGGATSSTTSGPGGSNATSTTAVSSSSTASSSSGAACGVTCAAGYSCMNGTCGNAVVDVGSFLATCAVLRAGEVWCWGRNVWGELGFAPSASDPKCVNGDHCQYTPKKITAGLPDPTVEPVVSISAGREANCALTSAGNVYCWGSNASGLLGHALSSDPTCTKATTATSTGPCSATPQKVALPSGIVATQISMGTADACALTSQGDVYCWGSNASGELGKPLGTAITGLPVANANANANVSELSVGSDESGASDGTCVRQTTGDIACWGGSASGNLFPTPATGACLGGDSKCTATAVTVPTVFNPPNGVPVTGSSVSVGFLVATALNSGSVFVWGADNYGQSGLGVNSPYPNHFDPEVLKVGATISAVSSPFLTTVMLDDTGSVWALGWNDEGAVGNGQYGPKECPLANGQLCVNVATKLTGLSGITKVRGGSDNSAAIGSDGSLWMWGSNYMASLGHTPGTAGDTPCGGKPSSNYCNPTPAVVAFP